MQIVHDPKLQLALTGLEDSKEVKWDFRDDPSLQGEFQFCPYSKRLLTVKSKISGYLGIKKMQTTNRIGPDMEYWDIY